MENRSFSLLHIGESGTPFTYGDSSASNWGDLNADGTSANDPIYVPRNTADPSEIVFSSRRYDAGPWRLKNLFKIRLAYGGSGEGSSLATAVADHG